jgi:hypothetical protein
MAQHAGFRSGAVVRSLIEGPRRSANPGETSPSRGKPISIGIADGVAEEVRKCVVRDAGRGDYIAGPDELERDLESLMSYFPQEASVRRLFIDEITAVAGWQKAIKRLADRGVLRKVLLITTGSKAGDIQREAELLPGRKGKLARSCSAATAPGTTLT